MLRGRHRGGRERVWEGGREGGRYLEVGGGGRIVPERQRLVFV